MLEELNSLPFIQSIEINLVTVFFQFSKSLLFYYRKSCLANKSEVKSDGINMEHVKTNLMRILVSHMIIVCDKYQLLM